MSKLFSSETLIESFIEATVGLIFALAAVTLIYSTPLRTYTSDISQKIILSLGVEGGALGPDRASPHFVPGISPSNWLFIDIGPEFCGGDQGLDSRSQSPVCPPSASHTDRARLAVLLKAVRDLGPRVVVLDVLTPPTKQEDLSRCDQPKATTDPAYGDCALLKELSRPTGAPVLLSWGPREVEVQAVGGVRSRLVARADDFLPVPRTSAARYLPALLRLNGPVAQELAPDYDLEPLPEGRAYQAANIALGAAIVAEAPPKQPFLSLDGFDHDAARSGVASNVSCARYVTKTCIDKFRKTLRIFSFSPIQRGKSEDMLVGALTTTYTAPRADGSDLSSSRLRDAVVVIGDSRASAGDRVWTPVGQASGGEVILNDIRQFLLADPSPTASPGRAVLEDLPFILAGFVSLFCASATANRLWPSHASGSDRGNGARDFLRALLRSGVRLALSFMFALVLFAILETILRSEFGRMPNFAAPFLAILVENVLELLHCMAAGARKQLERLLEGPGGAVI